MLQVGAYFDYTDVANAFIAVGAHLSLFKFNDLKTGKNDVVPHVTVVAPDVPSSGELNWDTGVQYAAAQNLSRELMELPANLMTPTKFCERITKEFEGVKNVELIIRDEGAPGAFYLNAVLIPQIRLGERKGHGDSNTLLPGSLILNYLQRTFLSVTHGTSEPAKFLEMCVSPLIYIVLYLIPPPVTTKAPSPMRNLSSLSVKESPLTREESPSSPVP